MTDITIPPEAVKEVAYLLDPDVWVSYSGKPREFKSKVDAQRIASMCRARAACLAMLKAWPGMEIETVFVDEGYLILPLPKEG